MEMPDHTRDLRALHTPPVGNLHGSCGESHETSGPPRTPRTVQTPYRRDPRGGSATVTARVAASTHEMIHCGVGATARGGGRARQGGHRPGRVHEPSASALHAMELFACNQYAIRVSRQHRCRRPGWRSWSWPTPAATSAPPRSTCDGRRHRHTHRPHLPARTKVLVDRLPRPEAHLVQ
jgi:hypothetical protein